jgi:hypothetical protein
VAKKKPTSDGIEEAIRLLARTYGDRLKKAIDQRLEEMKQDDRSHVLIYQVLGISDQVRRLVPGGGREAVLSRKIPRFTICSSSQYQRASP